jgi:hypothetical protein
MPDPQHPDLTVFVPLCECGDYEADHENFTGKCNVFSCGSSLHGDSRCQKFRRCGDEAFLERQHMMKAKSFYERAGILDATERSADETEEGK